MPAANIVEWIAGGNAPRKKRSRKNETVQIEIKTSKEGESAAELAAEPAPEVALESTAESEPVIEPEVASKSEMLNRPCKNCTCKKVQFKDKGPKSAMKKGTEKAKPFKENACTCDCKKCNVRYPKGDTSKDKKEDESPEENHRDGSASKNKNKQDKQKGQNQNAQQKQQKSNKKFSENQSSDSTTNSKDTQPKNVNSTSDNRKKSQEDPQSKLYSEYIRRSMSRLIQPPRSEVIIREDVIECPSDPKPNAFFDARIGMLRVYHGPHYGNAFGSLVPLANYQGISLGSTGGSRMPMTMGGVMMGGAALDMSPSAPMMSGAQGGWPDVTAAFDPANDAHWTRMSGPGTSWNGMYRRSGHAGQSGGFDGVSMRGGGGGWQQGRGNTESNDYTGRKNWGSEQQSNNGKHKKNWNQDHSGRNNNNENNSKGGNWGGQNSAGNSSGGNNVESRDNPNSSNNWNKNSNNNDGNEDWSGNTGDGNNDEWNNTSDDHLNENANEDSNSNQDNAEAMVNLPGAWNSDDNDGNDINGYYNNSGWNKPATPPGWSAEYGDAGDDPIWEGENSNHNHSSSNNDSGSWNNSRNYNCGRNQARGNQSQNNKSSNNNSWNQSRSSSNHQNNNNNNNNSSRRTQSRGYPDGGNQNNSAWNTATQTALSGGSWENSGTGPTGGDGGNAGDENANGEHNWGGGGRGDDNGNGNDDENGNGNENSNEDDNTWGPPKVQASWADPTMAATVSDWNSGGGGGGNSQWR